MVDTARAFKDEIHMDLNHNILIVSSSSTVNYKSRETRRDENQGVMADTMTIFI